MSRKESTARILNIVSAIVLLSTVFMPSTAYGMLPVFVAVIILSSIATYCGNLQQRITSTILLGIGMLFSVLAIASKTPIDLIMS
jgi:hypothetical protein